MSNTTFDKVCNLLNHKRAEVSWVCRPGRGRIIRMTRIVIVYPIDGAGRLRVAVTDWGRKGDNYEPTQHYATAGGYGYDKLTAALAGAHVGGRELGDHSDHKGRPILPDLCRKRNWQCIGSLNH